MHVPAGPLFLDLADVRAADPDLAGSFAAPLARAAQGGAPVPETTVVTAEACRRLAEIDDPRAGYHTPGDPAAPRQDPAVRALALAWHVAGSGGALPVVVHASPAGPYEHPALWRRAMTVGSWRRLLEVAAEIGADEFAAGEPGGLPAGGTGRPVDEGPGGWPAGSAGEPGGLVAGGRGEPLGDGPGGRSSGSAGEPGGLVAGGSAGGGRGEPLGEGLGGWPAGLAGEPGGLVAGGWGGPLGEGPGGRSSGSAGEPGGLVAGGSAGGGPGEPLGDGPIGRPSGSAALVVQRAVAITGSGRAWPGEPVPPGGGLDRGQAHRLTHMVSALGMAVRWGLDTVGNLWILACLGARVGAAPSAPACGAVA